MKFNRLVVLLFLGVTQAAFAQVTGGDTNGCCIKETPGHGGKCIYHAILPQGGMSCPGGFHFAEILKTVHVCPLRGAEPTRGGCPEEGIPSFPGTPAASHPGVGKPAHAAPGTSRPCPHNPGPANPNEPTPMDPGPMNPTIPLPPKLPPGTSPAPVPGTSPADPIPAPSADPTDPSHNY